MIPIRSLPEFYALQLYLNRGHKTVSADDVVVHDVVFDNYSEAKWLGEKMVANKSVISYKVFPVRVSQDSYHRMEDYLRFSQGV